MANFREALLQRWEIDRVPRMHMVADLNSEKDNVLQIHARVLLYDIKLQWENISAKQQ